MTDLKSPRAIWRKGILFLILGTTAAAGLLLLESPAPRIAALLVLTIWSFSRAYSFAFYVIERFVDPGYRFSGLGSFVSYLIRRRKGSD